MDYVAKKRTTLGVQVGVRKLQNPNCCCSSFLFCGSEKGISSSSLEHARLWGFLDTCVGLVGLVALWIYGRIQAQAPKFQGTPNQLFVVSMLYGC